jgi:hypothetical protein
VDPKNTCESVNRIDLQVRFPRYEANQAKASTKNVYIFIHVGHASKKVSLEFQAVRMSNFIKQRGISGMSDSGLKSPSRSPSAEPWYAESPKSPRPQSPSNFILGIGVHEDSSKSNSLVSKRLLNGISRLEESANSFLKDVVAIDVHPDDHPASDTSSTMVELTNAISEIEELVVALQTGKRSSESICESECFNCVTLQCENESMKARISGLEQELKAWKVRVDELSTASGRVTPPPIPHAERTGPSPLMSASMRLKSVTAALNKALHGGK